MIIRSTDDHLLLVTQTEHAALAERIMRAWRNDGLPSSPRRDEILLAARRHDDGWLDNDWAPLVDESSGRLLDYVHAPDDVRRGIWPNSVERLGGEPYAAALVAQHALQLFERYQQEPGWRDFFATMAHARDAHLAGAGPLTTADLQADYFFVRMGDLLSLQFCDDWREPQQHGPYSSSWDGARLTVQPDPFEGREVPLAVTARRLPARPFSDRKDAAAAYEAAPVETLAGVASGPRA